MGDLSLLGGVESVAGNDRSAERREEGKGRKQGECEGGPWRYLKAARREKANAIQDSKARNTVGW